MPALPTLNLLSWSNGGSAGTLSADADGAEGSAFQAALSERLSVNVANAIDAAVPDIFMPLDLALQVESFPSSAPLVLPTGDTGTGGSQLLATDEVLLVEVPMLSPTALPLQDGSLQPLTGAVGDAALLPGGDDAAVVQMAAGSPLATSPAGVSTAIEASDTAPSDTAQSDTAQSDTLRSDTLQSDTARSATAQPELLRQAAVPLSDAPRGAGDPGRSDVPGTDLQRTSPGAMPIATATPIIKGSLPGHAGADDSLHPAPALMGGAPIAAPEAQNSDFVQQLSAVSDLSRGAVNTIQTADGSVDASPAAAWANVASAARESGGAATLPLTLHRPMASPEWNQELGERIVWLAENNRQSAELQLNPRDLGPLAVRISVVDDVARVAFTAQNAVTREALEAAMPQLKEMLQSQGLSLGEANVSADNAPAEQQAHAGERGGYGDEAAAADDAGESAPTIAQTRHEGLFDGYA